MWRIIWRENKLLMLWPLASAAALFAVLYWLQFGGVRGESVPLFAVEMALLGNLILSWQQFGKMLARHGVFEPMSKRFKRVGAFIEMVLKHIAQLAVDGKNKVVNFVANALGGKHQRLGGYKDERISVYHAYKRLDSGLRKLKWRQLTTNRDRIRFIYIAFLRRKIKAGANVSPAFTPYEQHAMLHQQDKALKDELFTTYNTARYQAPDDEAASDNGITDDAVQHLRRYASRLK